RKQRCTQGISLVDSFTIDGYIDGAKGIIRGSCNGLLCLSDSGFPFHTLTLFNPTTRSVSPSLTFQCPRPIPHPSLDPNYPQQNTLFWGFGYDSLRDKYKFVIDCCNSSPSSSWSSGAIVCTFGGAGASKTVDHPAFQYHIYGSDGIFFNGTLNWSACDPITVCEEHMWSYFPTKKTWFVLTFDLETESFGRLCLPPENSHGVPHLQVMDNSTLSVCFRYPYCRDNFCVWIMKKKKLEDGVDDEKDYYWQKLFKVPYFTISSTRVAALYYFRDYNISYNFNDDHIVLTFDEYYHRLHMFRIRCYGGNVIGQPEIKPG
ncbi:hypothetical protein PIB30_098952, partial [Stylosanthes scabra]|nr:hypothetical protein [Stylosanthes scabra]